MLCLLVVEFSDVPLTAYPGVCVQCLCVFTSQCVCADICVCNYSDSQSDCPPSPTTKRILILSGLTVPPHKRGGGRGAAISFPWRRTRVNCLAFCSQLVMEEQGKESGKALKPGLRVKADYYHKMERCGRRR